MQKSITSAATVSKNDNYFKLAEPKAHGQHMVDVVFKSECESVFKLTLNTISRSDRPKRRKDTCLLTYHW